jgi:hypothetical protein
VGARPAASTLRTTEAKTLALEAAAGVNPAASTGHVNERGKPFHHKSVRAMLDD